MYSIFETETFLRSLEQNFGGQQEKVKKKLRQYVYQQLKTAPAYGPNIKRLHAWEPPTWRYRIGDYRFFYEIDEGAKIVSMTLAAHRSVAYRR